MDNIPSAKQPESNSPASNSNGEHPVYLSRTGWAAFVVCMLIVLTVKGVQQDWSPAEQSGSVGFLIGTAIGTILIVIIPPWLIWRFSKNPKQGHQILFYILLFLSTFGQVMTPDKSNNISPEFTNKLQQSFKEASQKITEGKVEDSSQPVLQALDDQAHAGGPEAFDAGVMADYERELGQITNALNAATKASDDLPKPSTTDPESYDRQIAADDAA